VQNSLHGKVYQNNTNVLHIFQICFTCMEMCSTCAQKSLPLASTYVPCASKWVRLRKVIVYFLIFYSQFDTFQLKTILLDTFILCTSTFLILPGFIFRWFRFLSHSVGHFMYELLHFYT